MPLLRLAAGAALMVMYRHRVLQAVLPPGPAGLTQGRGWENRDGRVCLAF